MAVSLEDLKSSLRVDSEADDKLLSGYILAALQYIKKLSVQRMMHFMLMPA